MNSIKIIIQRNNCKLQTQYFGQEKKITDALAEYKPSASSFFNIHLLFTVIYGTVK